VTPRGDRDLIDLRVLVVDDDADQRMLVRRLLERSGITKIDTAADGDAAIEIGRREQPDLILLDLAMPGRSGYEVLPELQAAAPAASIVILSNLPRSRLVDKLRQRGAVGYVEKLTHPDRLVREILMAAAMAGLLRERMSLTLDADAASSRAARRFVRGALAAEDDAVITDVELLVSELVTNAIVHASSAPRLEVTVSPASVHIAVHDRDPSMPSIREPGGAKPGGRGLRLVDQLASRWGAEPRDDGKVVWFEIDRVH